MNHFRPIDHDTDFLLPLSVQDGMPERHLARYIYEVVEGLDLRNVVGAYRSRGNVAYHPATLL